MTSNGSLKDGRDERHDVRFRKRWRGSGRRLGAAEPFVETNAPEAGLVQRHQGALIDSAAVVSSLGIAHDPTRVADGLRQDRIFCRYRAPAITLIGLGAGADNKLITVEAPSLSMAGLHSGNQAF
jgi:hypothetical protein